MTDRRARTPGPPSRRPPPAFRRVSVRRVEARSARLVRVTLAGEALTDLRIDQPAASVRVLVPAAGGDLVLPVWEGNEFLLPSGARPAIRTLTPRRVEGDELDVEIVLHGDGVAATWAATASEGGEVAYSGPGRGYEIDPDAPALFLAGDETAIPAISQLLESVPATTPVDVHVEVASDDARLELPPHPLATVSWHRTPDGGRPGDAFVAVLHDLAIPDGARIWVAGEAAAVQRVRRDLFERRGVPRVRATIRGYWKHGRRGTEG